jgi:hypothetical protein
MLGSYLLAELTHESEKVLLAVTGDHAQRGVLDFLLGPDSVRRQASNEVGPRTVAPSLPCHGCSRLQYALSEFIPRSRARALVADLDIVPGEAIPGASKRFQRTLQD